MLVVAGFVLPRLTRVSAPAFLMARTLADPVVYEDARRLGILAVVHIN